MTQSLPSVPQRLWHNRNFVLLWCAYGISALGDHLSEMGILKLKNALDVSVDATPIYARMTFMFFLPFLIMSPVGGILADRFSRRGLMILADLVRCAIVFTFGWLLAAVSDWGTLGQFAPILTVGLFAAIFSPARSALLPTIVPPSQLSRANGLISGLGILASMLAYWLGGILASTSHSVNVVFRLNSLTFVGSALCLAFLRPPAEAHTHEPTESLTRNRNLLRGLHYALAHRRVVELLVIAALVWFAGSMINSMVPAIVRDVFKGEFAAIGFNRALIGLGFVLGAGAITVLGKSLRHEVAITWGLYGASAAICALALCVLIRFSPRHAAILGGVLFVVAGFFCVIVIANYNAMLQRIVPNHVRGRIFGLADLCTTIALLVATGALGLPDWKGIDRIIGFLLLAVAVLMFSAGLYTFVVRMRLSPFRVTLTFWRHAVEMFARFWWRLERVGICTVPAEGGVIVTANHRCTADPLLLISTVPHRMVSFLVAKEYTSWPVFRYFTREGETIPVTRSGQDTAALKQSMRHLKEGKVLGIFIEGGIIPPNETPEPRDGVAMLALRTGAAVVPAFISGITYRDNVVRSLLERHQARVCYGKPVDLSDLRTDPGNRENVQKATERIYTAVKALAPPDDVYEGDEPQRKNRRHQRSARQDQPEEKVQT